MKHHDNKILVKGGEKMTTTDTDYSEILQDLHDMEMPPYMYFRKIDELFQAVEEGKISWEELGTSEEKLNNMRKEKVITVYSHLVDLIRGLTLTPQAAEEYAIDIRKAVEEGKISWEELGIKNGEKEFTELVTKAKE